MSEVRIIADEASDLTVATNPPLAGQVATLEHLYGIDGVDVGEDADDSDLVFPVAMTEGAPGVYSASVKLANVGVYWARVKVGVADLEPMLVRVVAADAPLGDGQAEVSMDLHAVVSSEPASVEISVYDRDGGQAGNQNDGTPWAWPQQMSQVPGYTDCWYFEDVTFDEGGRMQASLDPNIGPSFGDVIVVSAIAPATTGHFNGWDPTDDYDPSAWVPISYIREWTGWTAAVVSDKRIRNLRRHAVETFIDETNRWFPAWTGTFRGLRGQGSCLYLPMPIVLPREGGITPRVTYNFPEGDQEEVEELTLDDLAWRIRGRDERQPHVELVSRCWDPTMDVNIEATWGSVSPLHRRVPLKVQQVIVGLMRWHSLSHGVGPDDAKDQSTLFRIGAESTRDASVRYDDRAIGDGLTGDRTIDRALAELHIPPGPWMVKDGALPAGYGRR